MSPWAGREQWAREGQKQTRICNAEAFLELLSGRLLLQQSRGEGAVLLQKWGKAALMHCPGHCRPATVLRQPGFDRVIERSDRKGCLPQGDPWVRRSKEWSFTSSNCGSTSHYGPMVSPVCTSEPEQQRLVWAWTWEQMFSPSEILQLLRKCETLAAPGRSQAEVKGQTLLRGSKEKWATFPAGFLFIVSDQEIPNPGNFSGKLRPPVEIVSKFELRILEVYLKIVLDMWKTGYQMY